jgi:hypothetical protein
MATISNTPRPGYAYDSTDDVWYPIGTGPHTHGDYITQATAINPTIVDAKGDIIAASAADTVARLAVGANDTVLTADSSTATGLKWATPAAGGMTLLSTTTLSGASTTISSINQTYKDLIILISGMVVSSTGLVTVRLNNASNQNSIAAQKNAGNAANLVHRTDYIPLNPTTINSSPNNAWQIHINNYANTSYRKPFRMSGGYLDGTDFSAQNIGGMNNSIDAITSFVVFASTGTFSAGQVLVYGVN